MRLYLDSADQDDWAQWMPTGIFHGITTNPLLAQRAGLTYPSIDWDRMAERASALGARELHAQVYGPPDTYAPWAKALYRAGTSAGIETIVKIPLVPDAIAATPAVQDLGGRVLMTACYDAKQMIVATALGADFIAPYYGRMIAAGINADAHLTDMVAIGAGASKHCEILVASLRSAAQVTKLAATGITSFTIAPAIVPDLLTEPLSKIAAADFDAAAYAPTSAK